MIKYDLSCLTTTNETRFARGDNIILCWHFVNLEPTNPLASLTNGTTTGTTTGTATGTNSTTGTTIGTTTGSTGTTTGSNGTANATDPGAAQS